MLGGGEEGGSSSQSSSMSGYNAMPLIQQQAYDPFFQAVQNLWGVPLNSVSNRMVGQPRSPFDSQELYALQQSSPGKGVMPTGMIEPFNQFQQNALMQMGNPDYSQQAMQQYMNPFMDQVMNRTLGNINRQADMGRSSIMDNSSRINSRALGSSLGTQLAGNEEARLRAVGDASANLGYQGYQEGMNVRDNALKQQLGAGSLIQGQNQGMLDIANPTNQMKLNQDYIRAAMLAPLYGYMPQAQNSTSSSESTTGGGSNGLGQMVGLGMSIFG